jgi:hypothetical protein
MTATIIRNSAVLVVAAAFTAGAQAEYRCDPAPTWMDRSACEAADKSAADLRRFIQRMDWNRVNLKFSHYVDPRTEQKWDAQRPQRSAQNDSLDQAQKLASNERR